MLRSALQGKGYAKCLQLQNSIAIIPTKNDDDDDDVRRTLFANDQVNKYIIYFLTLQHQLQYEN